MEGQGPKHQILRTQTSNLVSKVFNYFKQEAENSRHVHSTAKTYIFNAEHMMLDNQVQADDVIPYDPVRVISVNSCPMMFDPCYSF
jgi:hypothetical protein